MSWKSVDWPKVDADSDLTNGVLRNIDYLDEDLILAELGNGDIFDHASRFLYAPKE